MAGHDHSRVALSDTAMSTVRRSLIAILVLAASLPGQTLKQIATIDLPGPKGQRFDYLTTDDEDQFLLSAHLGPGILYVIDMKTNKVVKAIPGVPGITGLEFVRETRKVYTSDWGEEKIGIVDLHSMTVVKRLATAAKPNGSTYAPPFHKVYVPNTLGKAVAVVDVDKDEIVKNIEFPSGGVDTRIVLMKDLVLTGYAAQTRSPLVTGGQTNLGAGLNYKNSWVEFSAERRKIGPNFNPEIGFLERNDCVCDYADLTLKSRPKIRGVRELNFDGFLFHAPDTHGVLQTQEWQTTFRAEFHSGAYTDDDIVDVFTQRIVTPFNIYKSVVIPSGLYHWTRHQLTYGTAQDRRWVLRFFERFGTYYNGHLNEARIRASYRPSERLSFDFSQQWDRFRLPVTGGDFSVVFGSFQTNYAFSRFLTLSTILQMNTSNTQAASANIRLRWNYRPDSDLFVIYTVGQQFASLVAANPAQFTQNRFAIKYMYSWRP